MENLSKLLDLGFSKRHIASMVGCSVSALRSDVVSDEVVVSLGNLVSFVEEIQEVVPDVASWFETPLLFTPITPIELFSAGRADLVYMLACGYLEEGVLEAFEPNWREKYRSNFKVFVAGDGILSIARV